MKIVGRLAAVVFSLLLSLGSVQAQGDSIDEYTFWQWLQQTNLLLISALESSDSDFANTAAQVNRLWEGVSEVRLADDTTLSVEVRWLYLPLSPRNDDLRQLQVRVQAVLDYQARRILAQLDPRLLQSSLEKILRDERFNQNDEVESDSSSDYGQSGNSGLDISASLGQVLLIGLALLALASVIVYVVKNLSLQRASIVLPESEEMPVTSQAAAEKAEHLITTQDFRMAIRYLYLASLLALDEQGIIRYDTSLTNREHLQQLSGQPQLYTLMKQVVDVFDRVWYGFLPADEQLYGVFRSYIDQLRKRS